AQTFFKPCRVFLHCSIVLAFSARFGIRFLWGFQPLSPFFEEIPCFQKQTSSVFNPPKAQRREAFPSLPSKTRPFPL
ncbi:hypothetical protein SOM12_09780, partial [Flavobacterium sp. CFBP9031]|uniref:hypothetical protein n=1 Tax=Flavobacterium sp. CFBP9031 TaxID=3096538 RepID=UPI002A6B453B